MNFELATATRILFGAGAITQVGPSTRKFGGRALVVTGRDPRRAERLLAELAANGIAPTLFSVSGEPEISTVESGVALARTENCATVISLGGGSVIDAGKAIAAAHTALGQLVGVPA